MGDGMSMRERADLDNHITGGGSPGIADEVEDFGAPIILAWYSLSHKHAPLADEVVNAVDQWIENEGFKSITAISLLKGYYSGSHNADEKQRRACAAFSRGFERGVDDESFDLEIIDEDDFKATYFSYALGHLAGSFTYYFGWATPYEKDADEPDTDEVNEGRDESEKIEVTHLATDSD